ncbi:MAG: hypothetical protein ABIR83_12025 [Nakamurella sp.]
MRTSRSMSMAAALLIGGATIAGCGSSSADRTTSIVTVTADTAAVGTTSAGPETSAGDPTSAGPGTSPGESTSAGVSTSAGDPTSAGPTSETMPPVVTVDPLKADCTKVLNPTELGKVFGQLPAGTGRLLEAANPDREITGRLKCQYGVAGSTIAVQVVLAQFSSQQAARDQMELTATTERQAGAKDSTTTVMGHPADVLIRDGGLIVVGYDTWTLSVVAADGIVANDALPAALEATAAYALDRVVANG